MGGMEERGGGGRGLPCMLSDACTTFLSLCMEAAHVSEAPPWALPQLPAANWRWSSAKPDSLHFGPAGGLFAGQPSF